ncbi:MAG: hypothetical protein OEX81_02930 [Candidatus Pacebacteria bacterium]|nr:hypothetical protein [Candidatus Paceibacterota bacterium]
MLKKIKQLDCWLDKIAPILALLLLVLFFRLPNLFEPYWYGDEGIYLTIGNALKKGVPMYQGIIDHKTPLIYYFAMVPSQIWFRVLNIVWSGASVILFFFLANRIIKNIKIVYFVSLLFTVLVSTPILEGNIPNGELFVMGFILLGGLFFVSNFIAEFVTDKSEKIHQHGCSLSFLTSINKKMGKTGCPLIYFFSGLMFGLAILTKVPAIFDVAAMLSIAWFTIFYNIDFKKFSFNKLLTNLQKIMVKLFIVFAGILTPIIGSIAYYYARGNGQDYLDFGLLYNFRYVQNWSLPFDAPWLQAAFTLQGKFAIALGIVLFLTYMGKKVSLRFKLVATWLVLSLFASTLSNRPYPHYYLQVVPAAVMVFGFIIEELIKLFSKNRFEKRFNKFDVGIGLLLLGLTANVFVLLNVGFYPTVSYYTRFYKYITKQVSREDYYQSFDSLMNDNYKAATIIQKSDSPYLFIWGTNPMLYAQTKKIPTGRFIVSFHVRDFNAYQETLDDFINKKPMFVVSMNNEEPIDGLEEYLSTAYIPNYDFDHFVLWKRISEEL